MALRHPVICWFHRQLILIRNAVMKVRSFILIITATLLLACTATNPERQPAIKAQPVAENSGKPVVYQVFTRLFGNTNTTNKPWGTLEENGVGKFNDFTGQALQEIKNLGVTHIWYTGVLH